MKSLSITPAFRTCAFVAVFTLGTTVSANAIVVADYEFNNNLTSSDSSPNTTAADFGKSPSIGDPGFASIDGVLALQYNNDGFNQTTESGAIGANDYISFSVDVDANHRVDFTDFSFRTLRRELSDQGLGAPDSFAIYTSQDGFAGAVGSGSIALVDNNTFTLQSFNFSSTGSLQNITTATEFRIYLWASQGIGTTSQRRFYVADVVLNGDVSLIPEPAAVSLLFGGAMGTLALLRRRRISKKNA